MKFLLLFLPLNVLAFTLNTNTAARFSKKEVKIYMASNSTCDQTGVSPEEILNNAVDGANAFWNRVPSSSLRIKPGGTFTTTDTLFNTGALCANDSENSCDSATTVPKVSHIVIACNNNTTNFPANSVLALSGPVDVSSSTINGSVILINNRSGSGFAQLSYNERRSVLAHEIGHAVGLGHTNLNHALMYFQNFDDIDRLAQDDVDGISYLYPNKLDGCGSFLGTINDQDSDSSFLKSTSYGLFLAVLFLIISKIITFIQLRYGHRSYN